MDGSNVARLERIATECVALVAAEHGRQLDWSLDSLVELDTVCANLLTDGPLSQQRLDLWRTLVGAYTGEVLIRTYQGQWTQQEDGDEGPPAVRVSGVTGFPFSIADRVLRGEPFKSLASFGRTLPAIVDRSQGNE